MTLTNDFIKTIPRENSGSNTSNAYDFQKDWSLFLLLECHERMRDYLLFLDYHDDIVLFDAEENPKNVEFFQVKTNRKPPWKLTRFIAKDHKKSGSTIIGKMYDNKIKFECHTKSINFVSNASFDFELSDDRVKSIDKNTICVAELTKENINKLSTAIKEDHGLSEEPEFENITFFRVTDLPVDGHGTHAIGRLTEFLEKILPDKKCKPVPLYRALFSEISKKTDYGKIISVYDESINRKTIGKKYFDDILNSIAVKRDFTALWTSVEQRLNSEGWPIVAIRKMRNTFERVEIDLLDHTNDSVQNAYRHVKEAVGQLIISHNDIDLTELIQRVATSVATLHGIGYPTIDEEYLKALALAAFYE